MNHLTPGQYIAQQQQKFTDIEAFMRQIKPHLQTLYALSRLPAGQLAGDLARNVLQDYEILLITQTRPALTRAENTLILFQNYYGAQ